MQIQLRQQRPELRLRRLNSGNTRLSKRSVRARMRGRRTSTVPTVSPTRRGLP